MSSFSELLIEQGQESIWFAEFVLGEDAKGLGEPLGTADGSEQLSLECLEHDGR